MLEVVRTIELEPVPMTEDAAPLRFRIEILREPGAGPRFYARLFRWEVFALQPFGTSSPDGPATEEILVADAFWDWRSNPAASGDEALHLVLGKLRSQLPEARFK